MNNKPNKKVLQFVTGDVVKSGNFVGNIVDIVPYKEQVVYKVVGLNGTTMRWYKHEQIQKVEFNGRYESNRYLESLLKQGKEEKGDSGTLDNMSVDELLDTYNSNKKLYELTGEEDFKAGMDDVMSRLKEISKE